MQYSKDKIIFFILIILMVLPPFFNGGRGALISSAALIFIGLAFLLFSGLDEKEKSAQNGKFFLSPLFFVFLFLIFSLITVFFSISPYNSFFAWLQYLSWAVLFFIAARLKIGEKEIDILIKIFLGVSAVLCIVGIYFYLSGNYIRLTSTFWWPNPFAGYLLFSLPLALYWFLKSGKELKKKLLPGLVLVLIFASFILTGSRGAFLSILLVAPAFYFFRKPSKKDIVSILLILLLSAILIAGINFLKQDGFRFASHAKKSFTDSDLSSSIRLNYWRGSWEIFKDYPVFGSGLGTFGTIYPQYQKEPISAGKYAHNLYLEMLSESGMFVLILFIIFLASVYWPARKNLKEKKYALPLFIGTLAFLIHNGADIDWHFGANTLVFWMFLGLFYNIVNAESSGRSIASRTLFEYRNRRPHKSFIIFISVLLIINGIIFLYERQAKQARHNGLG